MKARCLALCLWFATWRIEVWNARAARLKQSLSEIVGARS